MGLSFIFSWRSQKWVFTRGPSPRGHFLAHLHILRLGHDPQVWCVGSRMEGSHDTKPDHLSEDLLLASLLGGSLGAGRIRTSVPVVRPGLP